MRLIIWNTKEKASPDSKSGYHIGLHQNNEPARPKALKNSFYNFTFEALFRSFLRKEPTFDDWSFGGRKRNLQASARFLSFRKFLNSAVGNDQSERTRNVFTLKLLGNEPKSLFDSPYAFAQGGSVDPVQSFNYWSKKPSWWTRYLR